MLRSDAFNFGWKYVKVGEALVSKQTLETGKEWDNAIIVQAFGSEKAGEYRKNHNKGNLPSI
jgi:hypothetical protein